MGSTKPRRTTTTGAMQRNKRMARTLGCLVASMTLGAALLDWIQPTPAGSSAATARTELTSLVQQGTSAPGTWRSIQLDPEPPGKTPAHSHFVIGQDGQAFRTLLWQQQPAGAEGIVRIGLVASDNSNEVTPQQLSKAKELVLAIQHECSISSEQTHYGDTLAVHSVPPPAPSKHLASPARPSRHK